MRSIPTWLRGYDRGWLPADAMAGLTVWALMVPQALAYAGIAGVPVQNGLYVMPLAVVGYVLCGSSRHLFVGPSATVATLSASTVASSPAEHGLGRVHRPDLCADADGRRDLHRGRASHGWGSSPASSRGRCSRASSSGSASTSPSASCRRWWESRSRRATRSRCCANTIVDVGSWQWTTVAVGRRRAGLAVRVRAIRAEAARRDHRGRACDPRGPGARPAGPRRGDRRRSADRLSLRLTLERLGERSRRGCSPAPSRS